MFGLALLAAAAASPVCGPASAKTITANEISRVYREGGVVRACTKGGESPVPLASPGDDIPLLDVRLEGQYVLSLMGEGEVGPGQVEPYSTSQVFDLRSGALLGEDEVAFGDRAGDLAVDPGGFVAWIVRRREQGKVVDTVRVGDGVEPIAEQHWVTRRTGPLSGLGVSGRTITFTDGATPVRAELPQVGRVKVKVSPRRGGRRQRLTVKFTAPASPVGTLLFGAVAGSPGALSSYDRETCLGAALPSKRTAPGSPVRLVAAPFGEWCGGTVDGQVLAVYGPADPEDCKPAALPCTGSMRAGTFRYAAR